MAVGTALAFASPAVAQTVPSAPEQGYLILRNGHVLAGRIRCEGAFYIVGFDPHGEARLPASEVDMCCPTLEEAYFRKRDAIREGDVKSHLDLAEWCLRHQVLARAADQLLQAYALDPTNPRLGPLERRLLLAACRTPDPPAPRPPQVLPSHQQGMPLRGELPPGAVEFFTEKVQPLLLNRCASNACHGAPADGGFRLTRPLRGRSVPFRVTQRNLDSALALVDRERPMESRLLTVPRGPHGGHDEPVFGARDAREHAVLVEWVRRLACNGEEPQTPEAVASECGEPLPFVGQVGPGTTAATPLPCPGVNEPDAGGPAHPDAADRLRKETPSATAPPKDPFDPEIFNQRYCRSN